MGPFTYFLHVTIVGAIRILKWLELQVLLMLSPWLKSTAKKMGAEIGVIFHCPGDDEKLEIVSTKKYDQTVHIKVNNDQFFAWAANLGTLGGGEAFMHKFWDTFDTNFEDMTEFVCRVFENNYMDYYYHPLNRMLEWLELYAFNLQSQSRAFQVGKVHYDLGNDLYEIMLDPWMQYTCAYYKDTECLNQAQINKLELIAEKLDLKPGMRVLDLGCGWGTLCNYLSKNYKVECVGVTISKAGCEYGNRVNEGLPVEIRLQDYRGMNEKFDRVVSIGMCEHVGYKNYRTFMQVAHRCLKDDGLFLMHSIGRNHPNQQRSDPWSNKYVFPNGMVPEPLDVVRMTDGMFIIEDWHNFGMDYAKTLYAWRENFIKGWPKIKENYGGELFYRMWICYLSCARAYFKSRKLQLWQVVLSKDGLKRDYRAAR